MMFITSTQSHFKTSVTERNLSEKGKLYTVQSSPFIIFLYLCYALNVEGSKLITPTHPDPDKQDWQTKIIFSLVQKLTQVIAFNGSKCIQLSSKGHILHHLCTSWVSQSVLLQTENQFVVSDTKPDSCQRLCKNIHLLLASIKRAEKNMSHQKLFRHCIMSNYGNKTLQWNCVYTVFVECSFDNCQKMTWVPFIPQKMKPYLLLSKRMGRFPKQPIFSPLSDLASLVQQKRDYSWHLIRTFVDEAAFVEWWNN